MKSLIFSFLTIISIGTLQAQTWESIPNSPNGSVRKLRKDGQGKVYVCGSFSQVGNVEVNKIAMFDGQNWNSLGSENGFTGYYVNDVFFSNSDVYFMGQFTQLAGLNASCIARWDGQNWSSMNTQFAGSTSGFQDNPPLITCMAEFNGEFYAAGDFRFADGIEVNSIVKWNGQEWVGIGSGIGGMLPGGALYINGMTVYNNELYVYGAFGSINGVTVNGIAKFNGTSWESVGGGVSNSIVFNLIPYNSELFAVGAISMIGSLSVNHIAKWNGQQWNALPNSEFNSWVGDLAEYNGKLIAVGNFTAIGAMACSHIASFDGTSWLPLEQGLNDVSTTMINYQNTLLCGGAFTQAGSTNASYLAKWSESQPQATCNPLPDNLQNGLIGYWPFCGNANDESGNGNDGTVNGATLTEDRFGVANAAYSFDGVDDFVEVTHANELNTLPMSITAWVKTNQCCVEGSAIASKYYYASSNGFGLSYRPWSGTFSGFYFTPSGQVQDTSTTLVNDDNWHMLTMTVDNSMIKIYYNNNLLAEEPWTGNSSAYDNLRNLLIGKSDFPSEIPINGHFAGEIDDILFYNRVLTPDEVQQLYTGEPVNPPAACNPLPANLQNGLVGYWPFCGNANDESGNGNDGTVNGATLTSDRFGQLDNAFNFNGTSNYIEVPDDNSLDLTNQYSFSVWVELVDYTLNSANDPMRTMLSKPRSSEGTGYAFRALEGATGNPRTYVSAWNNGILNGYLGSIDSIPLGNWTNIVFTYDGVTTKLYKNGLLSNSGSLSLNLINSSQPLLLGKELNSPNSGRWFKGKLDDIGIWNRALTPDEVQQLYTLNACTFTIYDTVTVTETIYDTVSVSVSTTDTLIINTLITAVEPAQENTFLVYPNPASTQITINNGNVAILGGYTMRISNSLGQDVYNQNITQPQVTLDLSTWGGNGLYVLYIVDPQQNIVAVKQIVLQ